MTLEDAFQGALTSAVKGLQPMAAGIAGIAREVKLLTEAGDLREVKVKLRDLCAATSNLLAFVQMAEGRAAALSLTETGSVLDLSVPPSQRT